MRPVVGVLVGLGLACASAPPARVPDPAATSKAFFGALCGGHLGVAWEKLDPELRSRYARERFEALARENAAEIADLCQHLARTDAELDARARVELADGEIVVLVLEDGAWRVAGGLLDARALATPEEVVQELHRALRRRDLSALLALLARERRAVWAATLDRTLAATSDPLDLDVEIQGDEAVVRLTGGGELRLRREDDGWKIWDVR